MTSLPQSLHQSSADRRNVKRQCAAMPSARQRGETSVDTKCIGSNDKARYLRLLAGLSLWFSLALFVMVSVSLRRFTTPAARFSPADETPAAATAPAATPDARTSVPPVVTARVNASQPTEPFSRPSGPAKAYKNGPAELNPARQEPRQRFSLRSSTGATGASSVTLAEAHFIGSDSKKWRTDVPTYAKMGYESFYPDVDLVHNK